MRRRSWLSGRRRRAQRIEHAPRDVRDLIHCLLERRRIRTRGMAIAAHLTHELQRRRPYLLVGSRGSSASQGLNAPTHTQTVPQEQAFSADTRPSSHDSPGPRAGAKLASTRQGSSVVEQGTHKPLVGGSNPPPATNLLYRANLQGLRPAAETLGRTSATKASRTGTTAAATCSPRPPLDSARSYPGAERRADHPERNL